MLLWTKTGYVSKEFRLTFRPFIFQNLAIDAGLRRNVAGLLVFRSFAPKINRANHTYEVARALGEEADLDCSHVCDVARVSFGLLHFGI